jgi:hypothetical protein
LLKLTIDEYWKEMGDHRFPGTEDRQIQINGIGQSQRTLAEISFSDGIITKEDHFTSSRRLSTAIFQIGIICLKCLLILLDATHVTFQSRDPVSFSAHTCDCTTPATEDMALAVCELSSLFVFWVDPLREY